MGWFDKTADNFGGFTFANPNPAQHYSNLTTTTPTGVNRRFCSQQSTMPVQSNDHCPVPQQCPSMPTSPQHLANMKKTIEKTTQTANPHHNHHPSIMLSNAMPGTRNAVGLHVQQTLNVVRWGVQVLLPMSHVKYTVPTVLKMGRLNPPKNP